MAPVFWSNLIILPYVNFVCIEIIFFFLKKLLIVFPLLNLEIFGYFSQVFFFFLDSQGDGQ